jgi:hypothetical protein
MQRRNGVNCQMPLRLLRLPYGERGIALEKYPVMMQL